ncbi:succinyldiaminopimelate transaminase [Teredinibacter sp. KSP-S5-2]|uniref:succinyldiaminopimelate transaminase n=1 Tax=Teredinibacter sp. KSP-S5-2 TaxID=3034506 RepID=UPI002934151B|nr:succinyldiaminopimelate transaminase [Teredinibacter sp. KSP-S5-2]WNO09820.1 succinyldiaminopimelate transaminase [Teredinibacter sp. KSP-S5-2]
MNPNLALLQPYPFEKLNQLKGQVSPPEQLNHIALSIGEPKHEPPQFVLDEMQLHLGKVANYAATKGLPELRQAIALWAEKRFNLSAQSLDPEKHILPVNGSREALFAFTQAVVDATQPAKVVMPNPFYQIYEGAALLAGAEPVFANCTGSSNYLADLDSISEAIWQKTQMIFICTPGNPTGAVIPMEQLKQLINLSEKYDFIIASDECYSELYFDEQTPPPGLLQACQELGNTSFERCVVFHSLSKRSNLPGLRSGFVAGDAEIMQKFLLYRTYHGCAMPLHTQLASITAWDDEEHVIKNREAYRQKFDAVLSILDGHLSVEKPEASFYLWPETPIADTDFAQQLFAQQNVTVLPGSYLARDTAQGNPGQNRVRMALVASIQECIDAANRIKTFMSTLG